MNLWNESLDQVKPYTVASHKIWAVSPAERGGILKLDWNEAAVPPSPLVRRRLRELLDQDDFFHLYPSTFNEDLLRQLPPDRGIHRRADVLRRAGTGFRLR